MDRKILFLGIVVVLIGIVASFYFVKNVSQEKKNTYIHIEEINENKDGHEYIVGQDPYLFNSEKVLIIVPNKLKGELEVGSTYFLYYTKTVEKTGGQFVLDKIGVKK